MSVTLLNRTAFGLMIAIPALWVLLKILHAVGAIGDKLMAVVLP